MMLEASASDSRSMRPATVQTKTIIFVYVVRTATRLDISHEIVGLSGRTSQTIKARKYE